MLAALKGFNGVVHVGVDAQVSRDGEGFPDNLFSTQFGVIQQRFGRRLGKCTTGPNRDHTVLGFEHITIAGDDERRLFVRHSQHGLKAPQDAVCSPIFG